MNIHTATIEKVEPAPQETIESLKARIVELEGELEDAQNAASDAENRVHELETELEDVPEIVDGQIREMAKIRTVLKAGKCDEGRERLERVLGDLDGSWRTFA